MEVLKPVVEVFFVTEDEYPKLQVGCPGDFPFTYAQFTARVDGGIATLGDQVHAVRVEVNVARFLAWCATENRKPDSRARAKYAVHAGGKRVLD